MINHIEISGYELRGKIRREKIRLAGNKKLRIFGLLNCGSGKRMKASNRAFFATTEEAIKHRYRPCGHCMRDEYLRWKNFSDSGTRG